MTRSLQALLFTFLPQLFLVYIVFADDCGIRKSVNVGRVVGGREAHPNEFPWTVALQKLKGNHYNHFCGAVVINKRWLVSAAHCFYSQKAARIRAVFGTTNLAEENEFQFISKIEKIVKHEAFNRRTYENDIALLKTKEIIPIGKNISNICLPRSEEKIYGQAYVSGWGRIDEDDDTTDHLKVLKINLYHDSDCIDFYNETFFSDLMLCAGFVKGRRDACEGDSGGPLETVMNKKINLIGIVSFGRGCGRENLPGVYTEVSHYINWIKQQLEEDGDCCVCSGEYGRYEDTTESCCDCKVFTNQISSTNTKLGPKKSASISYAINAFSFKLDRVLSNSDKNENLFYSPIGIVYAFSMLMLGADNETELELFRGLRFNEVFKTPEEAHKPFKGLLKIFESNSNYSLDLANIILIQQNEHFLKNYTRRLGSFYKVSIGEVDFLKNGRNVTKDINKWVSRKTHNEIKDLFNSTLDPLTRLVIVNAVYFKGRWRIGFDKEATRYKDFFNYGRKPKQMPFMTNTDKYGYFENKEKNYQMLELKYVGDVSFFIILPKEKRGLDELLENFDISEIDRPLEEVKLQISVPKMKLSIEYDLKKVLPESGIKAIFGPGANLSGISGDKTLFVSTGIHKSMIEVNEEGTEAHSATAIGVEPTFTADHPFLFFIRNTKLGIIYFMGRVNEL